MTESISSLEDDFRSRSIPVNVYLFDDGDHAQIMEKIKIAMVTASRTSFDFLGDGYHLNITSALAVGTHAEHSLSDDAYVLFLRKCGSDVQRQRILFGDGLGATVHLHDSPSVTEEEMVESIVNVVQSVWFRAIPKDVDEHSHDLMPEGPSLQLELMLVNDGAKRLAWSASMVGSEFSKLKKKLENISGI